MSKYKMIGGDPLYKTVFSIFLQYSIFFLLKFEINIIALQGICLVKKVN